MAQGNVIERFFIALGLDTKDVEKGIDKTVQTVKGGLKELLVGAVLPAVGAFASGALVQQFTEEITQVDRLSKSLGINIERLQQWQGVAENAGVAGEEIGEIFADLNDWMVDADQNQSGAMYEYIEKGLLPAVRDVNGAMKSTEQYALELADAFAAMDKQQATGIGRQIGIGNAGLVAMFQQGSASISAQMQQIKQLGVYTEEDAKAAREFDKSSKELFRSLKMMLLPVFRLIVPIAVSISKALQELSKHAIALVPALTALGTAFTLHMLVPGRNVHRQVQWLAAAFARFGRAPLKTIAAGIKAIGVAIKGFMLNPVTLIIAALVALGIALDDFVGWMEGKDSLFGDFWVELFGDTENAKQTINDFVTSAKAAFTEFKEFASEVWQDVKPFVIAFGEGLVFVAKVVWNSLRNMYNDIKNVIAVCKELYAAGEEMAGRISVAIDNMRNTFNSVLDDIKNTVKNWWDYIAPIFDKVSSLFSMGDSISGFLGMTGDAALATPATAGAGTTNNQSNVDNSQYQITQNMTFNGVKDGEQAAGLVKDNAWSGLTAQGNASQSGSI